MYQYGLACWLTEPPLAEPELPVWALPPLPPLEGGGGGKKKKPGALATSAASMGRERTGVVRATRANAKSEQRMMTMILV